MCSSLHDQERRIADLSWIIQQIFLKTDELISVPQVLAFREFVPPGYNVNVVVM